MSRFRVEGFDQFLFRWAASRSDGADRRTQERAAARARGAQKKARRRGRWGGPPLLVEAKKRKLCEFLFGPTAFTVKMIHQKIAIEDKNLTATSYRHIKLERYPII